MLETIFSGLSYLGSLSYWGAVVAGVLISAAVGLIPGVGTPIVLAITIPFVVFTIQDPLVGIVLLATIGGVSNTLDSIPAVLLGYPGAATQVTFLEGHQLAQRGKAAHTLGAIYSVSALGGIVGAIALILVIPVIRPFILNFGYSEIAAMALFGVAMVSVLSLGAITKGIASGLIGILLATVGTHWGTATERFTFDDLNLAEGLPLIAITLGIFAMPEVLDLSATRRSVASRETAAISNRDVWAGARDGLSYWRVTIRQSLFGVFFGAVPGIGSSVIDWLSYGLGIACSKDKSQFGKGSLEGVIFAESAQNAKEGGQAIPTLAFGVPGGLAWVFVLFAMLSYGIAPGPQMLGKHADVTIMLAVSFAIGNLLVAMLGLILTGQLAKLTTIPYVAIGAFIVPISFLSAFQVGDGWFGILVLLVFAPIGLAMKAFKWPRAPLILGFILGEVIELNLQSAIAAHGIMSVVTRPLTISLILITVVTTVVLLRMSTRDPAAFMGVAREDGATPEPRRRLGNGLSLRGGWRLEHWFGLLVIAAGIWALWMTRGYPPSARFVPVLTAGGAILLTVFHLLFERRVATGQIMDIGMRSFDVPGAARTAFIIAGFVAGFLVLSALIGLQYASILFALTFPLVLMKGPGRYLASIVSAILVAMIAIGLLDWYMNVFWPDKVLWELISAAFV